MNKVTGFASPAQGYEEQTIDLNRLLVRPPATFFGRLETNDLKFLCRQLQKQKGKTLFASDKETFYPTQNDTEIFGVGTMYIY